MSEATITYCANHPTRETNLRCNRCGKFICSKCAMLTPTGYRCQDCVRGQQKVFITAKNSDYVVGFLVALVLSVAAAFLAARVGFFTLLLAPAAGSLIAEGVRAATGKRRSPNLYRAAAIGVAAGGAILLLQPIYFLFITGDPSVLIELLWPAIYIGLATSAAYYRLSGIQVGR